MEKGRVTVYLVRHAQTSGNVDMQMVDPELDILTELGKIQTNLLGMHLSRVNFSSVYSSDYGRALKTAEGIIKLSKTCMEKSIAVSEQLREVNFGRFENTSYTETFAYCKELNKPVFQWEFTDGESFPKVGQRMLNFIKDACEEKPKEHGEGDTSILVVSHSAAIACFLNALCESTSDEVVGMEQQDIKLMRNACYLKFDVERKSLKLEESLFSLTSDFKFSFLEKFYSKHLECIKSLTKSSNALVEFAKSSTKGEQYLGCVHQ